MMRGPSYDDGYISRKLSTLNTGPTFLPPTYSSPISTYGRSPVGDYMQDTFYDYDYYLPRGYSPAPRLPPRMPPPPYYDYDYGYGNYGGYGGYGGYGYGGYPCYTPPPVPRYSSRRYDLDDDYDLSYSPRYRPLRYSDTLAEIEKDKLRNSPSPSVPSTYTSCSNYMPGLEGEDEAPHPLPSSSHKTKARETGPPPEELRHSSLSEPQMLQDQVDKMRMRLKNLAYSLDPTGPVPEIVVPERSRRSDASDVGRKYSSGPRHLACVEYAGAQPQWKRRARTRYPSEDPELLSRLNLEHAKNSEESTERQPERLILKDRLSMKIHNYFSDSLEPHKFERYLRSYRQPGGSNVYQIQSREALSNTYTSKYPLKTTASKWEEPDTVYGSSVDRKPYSKPEEEEDDSKKERRKKRKSKERDEFPAASAAVEAASTPVCAPAAPEAPSEVSEPASAPETPGEGGEELDEKEKKRLEKKKRKAEREAAAKAAMEAELAALAAAEAELAKLEADATKPVEADAAPAATETPAAAPEPAKGSEPAAEKCESPTSIPSEELTPSECPPTELEPEPRSPTQPQLESTDYEPVPEEAPAPQAEEAEAIPGFESAAVEQDSTEQEPAAAAESESPIEQESAPPAEEEVQPPPSAEEASEEPQIAPKPRSQGEDAFDWSGYEAQGSGGDEAQQIGTQESVPDDKDLQQGTCQEPVDATQPEELQHEEPEHKEQEPEIEQTTEEPIPRETTPHTESEPQMEEPTAVEEQAATEPELEPSSEPALEQTITEPPEQKDEAPTSEPQELKNEAPSPEPPVQAPTEEQVEQSVESPQEPAEEPQEPAADFKPLDESDSFWGEEE